MRDVIADQIVNRCRGARDRYMRGEARPVDLLAALRDVQELAQADNEQRPPDTSTHTRRSL